MLVEGEANAVAVQVMDPDLRVLGLPGQAALNPRLADELGHVPVVYVWIDRHEKGAQMNAERIARLLRAAGVEEVRLLPQTAGFDANDALRQFDAGAASQTLTALLDQATPLASAPLGVGAEVTWPAPLQQAALNGLAGEVVATIEPHCRGRPGRALTSIPGRVRQRRRTWRGLSR